jgi:hypothetical protein
LRRAACRTHSRRSPALKAEPPFMVSCAKIYRAALATSDRRAASTVKLTPTLVGHPSTRAGLAECCAQAYAKSNIRIYTHYDTRMNKVSDLREIFA